MSKVGNHGPRATGPRSAARATAITLLFVLTGATGCGGPTEASPAESSAPGSPARTGTASPPAQATPAKTPQGGVPDPKRLDHGDATAVSRAAVTTMWSVDSTIDTGQHDAYRRARPYFTPEYYASIATERAGAVPSSWQAHRAYGSVRLAPQQRDSGAGADTPTTARRQWGITVVPTGRDGWKGSPVEAVAFVTLTRATPSAPWRVSNVTTG